MVKNVTFDISGSGDSMEEMKRSVEEGVYHVAGKDHQELARNRDGPSAAI